MTYAEPKVATTWKALNGRRYLTRTNAYKASARALIKARCQRNAERLEDDWCEDGNFPGEGQTCRRHSSPYNERLVARLARWMKWRDGREVAP